MSYSKFDFGQLAHTPYDASFRVPDETVDKWLVWQRNYDLPAIFVERTGEKGFALRTEAQTKSSARGGHKAADALKRIYRCQIDGIVYEPSQPHGLIEIEGRRVLNLHDGCGVEPAPGDVGPWLALLEAMVPDPTAREAVTKWAATLIARPDVRMTWGLILYGISISHTIHAFQNTLFAAVGPHNAIQMDAGDLGRAHYEHPWANKRLVSMFWFSHQTARLFEKIKERSAADAFHVRSPDYLIKNKSHVLIKAEDKKILKFEKKLPPSEKRFLALETREPKGWPQQTYTDWLGFDSWQHRAINGQSANNLAAVLAWAREYVAAHGAVGPNDPVPDLSA